MSKWFKEFRRTAAPDCRIICFPYAGGNASVFNHWVDLFPSNIDFLALQAPGRECRFKETPISSLVEMVSNLRKEIRPLLDVPTIFVGHSDGALLAFELLRALDSDIKENVRTLILGAKRAPHLVRTKAKIHDIPFEDFRKELGYLQSIPHEVLNNNIAMKIFSPLLRADLSIGENYQYISGPKEPVDAVLLWGRYDKDVSVQDVRAWERHFCGNVTEVPFDGEHLFVQSHRAEYLQKIHDEAIKVISRIETTS